MISLSCMFVIVVMPRDGPVYLVDVVFFCYLLCFSHSFCIPILASKLLGPSPAYTGYRDAPMVAWVLPWFKPYASIDIKEKKKKGRNNLPGKTTVASTNTNS